MNNKEKADLEVKEEINRLLAAVRGVQENAKQFKKLYIAMKPVWPNFSLPVSENSNFWAWDHKGVHSLKELTPLLVKLGKLGYRRDSERPPVFPKNGLTAIVYFFVHKESGTTLRFNTDLIVGKQGGEGCYRVQTGEEMVPVYTMICPDDELEVPNEK